MWADHYAKIEELFAQLAPTVTPLMPESEVAFLDEYLDACEYGLALEALVESLIREGAAIPGKAHHKIAALSGLMPGIVDDQLNSIKVAEA
jgi:hypothetical protein